MIFRIVAVYAHAMHWFAKTYDSSTGSIYPELPNYCQTLENKTTRVRLCGSYAIRGPIRGWDVVQGATLMLGAIQ